MTPSHQFPLGIVMLPRRRMALLDFAQSHDVSDTALMTCLVTSETEGLHVHFVDGGGGGYTSAARQLKAARAARG